jgi:curli biogenesis system outer membrane secretion channel CsgG
MRTFFNLLFGIILIITIGCAGPQTTPTSQEQPIHTPYYGPKKTIAVTKFDASGAFVAKYGSWDIGGGLAAMLVSELNKSNRFIVVDRADLAAVFREHEMALQGLTATKDLKAGQLLGAQLLIRGSVTEFDEAETGGGFKIGAGTSILGGAVGPQFTKGHVTVDLRMIETNTARVVETQTIDKKITGKALATELTTKGVNFGGDVFNKTPLGKASREAIQEAVSLIIERMEKVPWQALVAKVAEGKVYINAGENANLKEGNVLTCCRVIETITDPVTKEVLGVEEQQIGQVKITMVAPKYSTATYEGTRPPKMGDILRLTSR